MNCGGCGRPTRPAELRLLRLPVETGTALEVRDAALCGACRGTAALDAVRYGRAYELLGLA